MDDRFRPPGGIDERRRRSSTAVLLVLVALLALIASVWRPDRPDDSLARPSAAATASTLLSLCRTPPAASAPATGTELAPARGAGGSGELTIHNTLATDVAVKLVAAGATDGAQGRPPEGASGRPFRFVYVRAGDEATVVGLPDGMYQLLYARGSRWNAATQGFECGAAATRLAPAMTFPAPAGDGRPSRAWRVTLKAPAGNATPVPISPEAWSDAR